MIPFLGRLKPPAHTDVIDMDSMMPEDLAEKRSTLQFLIKNGKAAELLCLEKRESTIMDVEYIGTINGTDFNMFFRISYDYNRVICNLTVHSYARTGMDAVEVGSNDDDSTATFVMCCIYDMNSRFLEEMEVYSINLRSNETHNYRGDLKRIHDQLMATFPENQVESYTVSPTT